jgi:3-phenylpropionate/trans-cinnamate dioxygenase ferredoxin component
MTQHRVIKTTDIAAGEIKRVEVDGLAVCVVHAEGGEFFAMKDICSHEAYPLSDGWTYDKEIECGHHNAIFDMTTGEVLSLPATKPIRMYQVVVDGDDVVVSIDDEDEDEST